MSHIDVGPLVEKLRKDVGSMGYVEEAAAVFSAAADAVPVGYAFGIDQQLGQVAQYAAQAGGSLGEALTQEALAAQRQAQELSGMLAGLKDKLQAASAQVLTAGG